MTTRAKTKKGAGAKARKWSGYVAETSNALDLEKGIFKSADPKKIARSLKRSAAKSDRRKSSPYRSAMSMLSFYINRAGKKLSKTKLAVLERAKKELKVIYSKEK